MEPEGGDVLREALWSSKEDAISDEELKDRNTTYLIKLELKLRELGLEVQDPTHYRPGYKLFALNKLIQNRHPRKNYESRITVYVPVVYSYTTVTCVVYDTVRMNIPRPGQDRMDECVAGHTFYTSTFSLDLCRAMIEEDYEEFVKILEGVVKSRKTMSSAHQIVGNEVDPLSFGLMKNSITNE